MIDSFTKKPIRVSDDDDAGPYIIVRLDQLGLVEKLLDDAGYHHDVDEDAISINDHPYCDGRALGTSRGRRGHPKTARRQPGPQRCMSARFTSVWCALVSREVFG